MPKSAQGQTMPRDFWQPLPSSDLKRAITGLWGVAFREALGMGTWADGWEELGFFETALHSNLGQRVSTHPLADLTETPALCTTANLIEPYTAAYTPVAIRTTVAPLVWRTWRSARYLLAEGFASGAAGPKEKM